VNNNVRGLRVRPYRIVEKDTVNFSVSLFPLQTFFGAKLQTSPNVSSSQIGTTQSLNSLNSGIERSVN